MVWPIPSWQLLLSRWFSHDFPSISTWFSHSSSILFPYHLTITHPWMTSKISFECCLTKNVGISCPKVRSSHTPPIGNRRPYQSSDSDRFYSHSYTHCRKSSAPSFRGCEETRRCRDGFCTDAFTHRHFYTDVFTQRRFYTHKNFHTQTLLQTETFTHRPFHTYCFTHRRWTHGFYTRHFST